MPPIEFWKALARLSEFGAAAIMFWIIFEFFWLMHRIRLELRQQDFRESFGEVNYDYSQVGGNDS